MKIELNTLTLVKLEIRDVVSSCGGRPKQKGKKQKNGRIEKEREDDRESRRDREREIRRGRKTQRETNETSGKEMEEQQQRRCCLLLSWRRTHRRWRWWCRVGKPEAISGRISWNMER